MFSWFQSSQSSVPENDQQFPSSSTTMTAASPASPPVVSIMSTKVNTPSARNFGDKKKSNDLDGSNTTKYSKIRFSQETPIAQGIEYVVHHDGGSTILEEHRKSVPENHRHHDRMNLNDLEGRNDPIYTPDEKPHYKDEMSLMIDQSTAAGLQTAEINKDKNSTTRGFDMYHDDKRPESLEAANEYWADLIQVQDKELFGILPTKEYNKRFEIVQIVQEYMKGDNDSVSYDMEDRIILKDGKEVLCDLNGKQYLCASTYDDVMVDAYVHFVACTGRTAIHGHKNCFNTDFNSHYVVKNIRILIGRVVLPRGNDLEKRVSEHHSLMSISSMDSQNVNLPSPFGSPSPMDSQNVQPPVKPPSPFGSPAPMDSQAVQPPVKLPSPFGSPSSMDSQTVKPPVKQPSPLGSPLGSPHGCATNLFGINETGAASTTISSNATSSTPSQSKPEETKMTPWQKFMMQTEKRRLETDERAEKKKEEFMDFMRDNSQRMLQLQEQQTSTITAQAGTIKDQQGSIGTSLKVIDDQQGSIGTSLKVIDDQQGTIHKLVDASNTHGTTGDRAPRGKNKKSPGLTPLITNGLHLRVVHKKDGRTGIKHHGWITPDDGTSKERSSDDWVPMK